METPLTPLEFMRRTRRLHPSREAVVDRDLRLTYEQFSDRCDRWAAALQRMGIRKGDRVAYIAANVHRQLESVHSVPQLGAVLVPINYRLSADDFAYIIEHSGARVVCADAENLEAVDRVRDGIRLAHFKTPQWITFTDELPKTATGKIQKYVLRKGAPAIVAQ